MKKNLSKISILLLAVLCIFLCSGDNTSAATKKPSFEHSSTVVAVSSVKTVEFNNNKKKVVWKSSNSKIASIASKSSSKVTIKGNKTGTATIYAKVGGKTYKLKVVVVKKSAYTVKHKGYATFYDRVSGGAANFDDFESTYLTAALNTEDYMNNMAGAYLLVTDGNGDKVKVLITDRLPEGAKGDIDLSRKAFNKIEPLVTGKMKVSWKIIPLPTSKPISYVFKPTSSVYWAEVQVRNYRYPIASLEYYDKSKKKYVALQRQEYNYFTAPSGMGKGPYTFRVKDVYGHVLVDKNIAMNNTCKPVKGKANFPY